MITALITIVTAIVSVMAFKDEALLDRLAFKSHRVLAHKEWYRMVSSSLVHGDWRHLAFNLISFYAFARTLELVYGAPLLLALYFGSVFGGALLSLAMHRHHVYSSVGASGGICGIIFAIIFLLPGTGVNMFFIPIPIPAIIYGPSFLLISYFGIKNKTDNVGHIAHFGGALAGTFLALAFHPSVVLAQPVVLGCVVGLSALLLFLLKRDPTVFVGSLFGSPQREYKSNLRYQRYDEARERNAKKAELDRLLDQIAERGIGSLSRAEKQRLTELSKKYASAKG